MEPAFSFGPFEFVAVSLVNGWGIFSTMFETVIADCAFGVCNAGTAIIPVGSTGTSTSILRHFASNH